MNGMDNVRNYDDGNWKGTNLGSPEAAEAAQPDTYAKRVAKNGRILYFKNGKMFKQSDIPEGVMIMDLDTFTQRLQTVDAPTPEIVTVGTTEKQGKQCLWDDGPAENIRFVNGRYIDLCQTHYQSATLGKIVQHIREAEWNLHNSASPVPSSSS